MAKNPGIIPTCAQTVGGTLDSWCDIMAWCELCRQTLELDLAAIERLVATKGRDYSLIGRRSRCKLTPGCTGWVRFHYRQGVYRPLWEYADVDRWLMLDEAALKKARKRETDAVNYSGLDRVRFRRDELKVEISVYYECGGWRAELSAGRPKDGPPPHWTGRGDTAQAAVDNVIRYAGEYYPPVRFSGDLPDAESA